MATCPICFEAYTVSNNTTQSPNHPMNLLCGHTCCKTCVQRLIRDANIKHDNKLEVALVEEIKIPLCCPICKKKNCFPDNFTIENATKRNFLLEEMIEVQSSIKCIHNQEYICANTYCYKYSRGCLTCLKRTHSSCQSSDFVPILNSRMKKAQMNVDLGVKEYLEVMSQYQEDSRKKKTKILNFMKVIQQCFDHETKFFTKSNISLEEFVKFKEDYNIFRDGENQISLGWKNSGHYSPKQYYDKFKPLVNKFNQLSEESTKEFMASLLKIVPNFRTKFSIDKIKELKKSIDNQQPISSPDSILVDSSEEEDEDEKNQEDNALSINSKQ